MKIFYVLAIAVALAVSQGCSIGKALSGPPPIEMEKVVVGETRNNIINVIGIPKSTESRIDSKIDMHEFIDGFSGGSKVRVILYIAGDVFTAGLSELIFWPIELIADGGNKGRAIITYGLDDIAKSVLITQADGQYAGKPWGYTEVQQQSAKIGPLDQK